MSAAQRPAVTRLSVRVRSNFADVVTATENSNGWFLFPAGRRPRQQLLGDAIRTRNMSQYTWIGYNTMRNPKVSKQLREKMEANALTMEDLYAPGIREGVNAPDRDMKTPVPKRVIYKSQKSQCVRRPPPPSPQPSPRARALGAQNALENANRCCCDTCQRKRRCEAPQWACPSGRGMRSFVDGRRRTAGAQVPHS